jgi:DNA-binding protein YbaB
MTSGIDPDFALLAQRAQQAKNDLATAQAALANSTVEGFGGGGAVRAILTGTGEVQDIVIEPGSVDPTRLRARPR